MTYVPAFWSENALKGTVLTSIAASWQVEVSSVNKERALREFHKVRRSSRGEKWRRRKGAEGTGNYLSSGSCMKLHQDGTLVRPVSEMHGIPVMLGSRCWPLRFSLAAQRMMQMPLPILASGGGKAASSIRRSSPSRLRTANPTPPAYMLVRAHH